MVFFMAGFIGCQKPEDVVTLPTVATIEYHSVSLTAATAVGNIIDNGGDSILERGICLSRNQMPTILDQKVLAGSGNGDFSAGFSGLTANTQYYIRAYAINAVGIAYGNELSLTTYSGSFLRKDSTGPDNFERFEYNSNGQLVKFLQSIGANQGYVDTFIYENNLLVESKYSLGLVLYPATPYARSVYQNVNGLPATSQYYLGTTVHSRYDYVFDNNKRLIKITQRLPNGTTAYVSRFEYDANSNLTKVFRKDLGAPEYMAKEFLNYDNHKNPFYTIPWYFELDLYVYNVDKLSPNNVGQIKTYYPFTPGNPVLTGVSNFTHTYDEEGNLSKIDGFYKPIYFLYGYR